MSIAHLTEEEKRLLEKFEQAVAAQSAQGMSECEEKGLTAHFLGFALGPENYVRRLVECPFLASWAFARWPGEIWRLGDRSSWPAGCRTQENAKARAIALRALPEGFMAGEFDEVFAKIDDIVFCKGRASGLPDYEEPAGDLLAAFLESPCAKALMKRAGFENVLALSALRLARDSAVKSRRFGLLPGPIWEWIGQVSKNRQKKDWRGRCPFKDAYAELSIAAFAADESLEFGVCMAAAPELFADAPPEADESWELRDRLRSWGMRYPKSLRRMHEDSGDWSVFKEKARPRLTTEQGRMALVRWKDKMFEGQGIPWLFMAALFAKKGCMGKLLAAGHGFGQMSMRLGSVLLMESSQKLALAKAEALSKAQSGQSREKIEKAFGFRIAEARRAEKIASELPKANAKALARNAKGRAASVRAEYALDVFGVLLLAGARPSVILELEAQGAAPAGALGGYCAGMQGLLNAKLSNWRKPGRADPREEELCNAAAEAWQLDRASKESPLLRPKARL